MFKKYDQNQQFLSPVRLDSFVPEDHIARIINDIIEAVQKLLSITNPLLFFDLKL